MELIGERLMRLLLQILASLSFATLCLPSPSIAATTSSCPYSHHAAFTAAIVNEGPVYAARNAIVPAYEFDEAEIESRIQQYLSHFSTPGANKSGLMFYLSSGGKVCLFLFENGPSDKALSAQSFILAEDSAAFSQQIARNLEAIVTNASGPARQPHLRTAQPRSAEAMNGSVPTISDVERRLGDLRDLLIPEALRADLELFGSLSIVPALNIGVVPFSALDPDADGTPLVASVALNVEASIYNIYQIKAFGWEPGFRKIAIFGDPATQDPEWIFPRLPGAVREAERVAELTGGSALFGADATVEAVLAAIQTADYVHIAAHGISDAVDPMEKSFLALSGGRLLGIQIENLRLPEGQLVVLSACQSGLGLALDGGVAGLSRAFIFGGSMLVVSSLWNVDDVATASIMARFVELLSETNPIEALRQAQNEAREQWKDPRLWASFVAFGGRVVSK